MNHLAVIIQTIQRELAQGDRTVTELKTITGVIHPVLHTCLFQMIEAGEIRHYLKENELCYSADGGQ